MAIPRLCPALPPQPPQAQFTSLFTIVCSQAVLEDSNPTAICIDLDTKGIAAFDLSTWLLVATAPTQGGIFGVDQTANAV